MGDEVDACFALPTRKHVEAREQIVIRQSTRGGEDVGLHASCVSQVILGFGQGPETSPQRRVRVPSPRAMISAQKRLGAARSVPTARVERAGGGNRFRTSETRSETHRHRK